MNYGIFPDLFGIFLNFICILEWNYHIKCFGNACKSHGNLAKLHLTLTLRLHLSESQSG